jgi:hypothetical protein
VTIGLSGTLFGGLGRVIGRVKHWLWLRMDIDKSKNAEIGAEGHEGEVRLLERQDKHEYTALSGTAHSDLAYLIIIPASPY